MEGYWNCTKCNRVIGVHGTKPDDSLCDRCREEWPLWPWVTVSAVLLVAWMAW